MSIALSLLWELLTEIRLLFIIILPLDKPPQAPNILHQGHWEASRRYHTYILYAVSTSKTPPSVLCSSSPVLSISENLVFQDPVKHDSKKSISIIPSFQFGQLFLDKQHSIIIEKVLLRFKLFSSSPFASIVAVDAQEVGLNP